jgi:hypothetical protein
MSLRLFRFVSILLVRKMQVFCISCSLNFSEKCHIVSKPSIVPGQIIVEYFILCLIFVKLFLPSVVIDFYFLDQFIIFAASHAWQ